MKKIFVLLLAVFAISATCATTTHYARKNQNLTFDLNWGAENYGTVKWQKSTDGGNTWNDIDGATEPVYTFKITSEGLYRAYIEGDKACPPIILEKEVKMVDFSVTVNSSTANSAEIEVSNLSFQDAKIVEYGFCHNFSSLSRNYALMPKTKVGETLPEGDSFIMQCEGLRPAQSYSVRVYFKTEDGSILYGPGKLVNTLEGLEWSSEDWVITKNSIGARFRISGYSSDADPQVEYYFGKDANSLVKYDATNLGDHLYSAEVVESLTPNTEYLAVVKAMIDGEEVEISKTVKTWSDYSTIEVDETVTPVQHTIRWDNTKKLTQLTPDGLQVEYPRMLRVDENKLLFTYHGGSSDHWQNCYLRKSYDNGRTWSKQAVIYDKENSNFGNDFWRIVNPEMTKLENGWIIMSVVGNGKPETNHNCKVIAAISKDGGETWGDPIIVGRGRTWEPQIIQLPNGELELYVSSEARWYEKQNTLYQEIVMARSTDNGETWTSWTRASYNPNCRDGMPVAIRMQGNKGILYTIETIGGSPCPSVLHRDLDAEWDSADWDGKWDEDRWGTTIGGGGAPYCLQLPTGEIVISSHVGGTGVWQTGRPQIVVGDNTGHNFTTPVTPLAGTNPLPSNTGAYYNSMFLYDNETVWLLITKAQYDGNRRVNSACMFLEGKIVEKK